MLPRDLTHQKEDGERGEPGVILLVERHGVERGGDVVPDAEDESAQHLHPEPTVSARGGGRLGLG